MSNRFLVAAIILCAGGLSVFWAWQASRPKNALELSRTLDQAESYDTEAALLASQVTLHRTASTFSHADAQAVVDKITGLNVDLESGPVQGGLQKDRAQAAVVITQLADLVNRIGQGDKSSANQLTDRLKQNGNQLRLLRSRL